MARRRASTRQRYSSLERALAIALATTTLTFGALGVGRAFTAQVAVPAGTVLHDANVAIGVADLVPSSCGGLGITDITTYNGTFIQGTDVAGVVRPSGFLAPTAIYNPRFVRLNFTVNF